MDADRVVLTSAMVTLGSTVGASILPDKYGGRGELPTPRLLFGTALTFTGLSMLAEFRPEVGAPLALAVAVTAALFYGFPLAGCYFDPSNCTKYKSTFK